MKPNPLDRFDLTPEELYGVVWAAERRGSRVTFSPPPEGGAARHVGTFEGRRITLYDDENSPFALAFTVSHLYGHQVQLTAPTEAMRRSIDLVTRAPGPLTLEEVDCVRAYEYEAAEIGLQLIAEGAPTVLRGNFRAAYTRYFEADFRYLLGVLEAGEAGAAVFNRYLRHEPMPEAGAEVRPANRSPATDLRVTPPEAIHVTVV